MVSLFRLGPSSRCGACSRSADDGLGREASPKQVRQKSGASILLAILRGFLQICREFRGLGARVRQIAKSPTPSLLTLILYNHIALLAASDQPEAAAGAVGHTHD